MRWWRARRPQTMTLEVRIVTDPEGQPGVLLQFKDSWLVTSPAGARKVAALLLDVADEVEGVR